MQLHYYTVKNNHTTRLKKFREKKIGDEKWKIADKSGLVTVTVLNTKISEVENKAPNQDKKYYYSWV